MKAPLSSTFWSAAISWSRSDNQKDRWPLVGAGPPDGLSGDSGQEAVSLCPASFCSPRVNLPFTPGISQLPTFAFQPPMLKRTFLCVCASSGSFS